ncbi:MAG: bifunctional methionine sulfoxide reductase B/A protein [Verrucomicrobia bacterium]|nr:bifunctional methionine sulfoxide reductase B/A protein [Verrucomicrobiota bacterium]
MKTLFFAVATLCLALILGVWAVNSTPPKLGDASQIRAKLEAISMNDKVKLSEEAWRKILTPEQFYVMRERGTEKPFANKCANIYQEGTFVCAACGNPLFESGTKFESGTGWPSFNQALEGDRVKVVQDTSHGMVREEVQCARCGSHLGHVFNDGPPPTGLRYCMNGVALKLVHLEKATFAAGCFWGVQAAFDETKGVLKTHAGYTGGHVKNPTYDQVCSHTTGHAEAVEVEFDPTEVKYKQLVDLFWSIHDPRQVNRQGPDIGDNYRSAIFTHTPEQKAIAEASKAELEAKGKGPIATEIVDATEFYPAEAYHQHFKSKTCRIPR